MRYDIANTLPVLEQIREEIREALEGLEESDFSPAEETVLETIASRLAPAETALKQVNSSFEKYKSNPRKYAPQLDNLYTAAKMLYGAGRVIAEQAHKLKKR